MPLTSPAGCPIRIALFPLREYRTFERRPARWFFEVYPHPAHVVLFGLDRIVKYKKGRVEARRQGQRSFAALLETKLSDGKPRLVAGKAVNALFTTDPQSLRGKALKANEDRLDALLCCYLAAHYWYWGSERNEFTGASADGGIVVPTMCLDAEGASAHADEA
ncbi:MAG: DUF429 domain-containing protein [Gemmatimonadota bacterium]